MTIDPAAIQLPLTRTIVIVAQQAMSGFLVSAEQPKSLEVSPGELARKTPEASSA